VTGRSTHKPKLGQYLWLIGKRSSKGLRGGRWQLRTDRARAFVCCWIIWQSVDSNVLPGFSGNKPTYSASDSLELSAQKMRKSPSLAWSNCPMARRKCANSLVAGAWDLCLEIVLLDYYFLICIFFFLLFFSCSMLHSILSRFKRRRRCHSIHI
jgi:hypothetical protein